MTGRAAIVRTAVGGLLLAAAGLKLAGLAAAGVPAVGWTARPWVQAAAAGWEVVLGAWLVGGAAPRAGWAAAVLTFAGFAAVSASLGLAGVASCGCLGVVETSPWLACGIDVAALLLLAAGWPGVKPTPAAERSRFGGVVLAAALVLVGLGAAGSWATGSPAAALARLRGDPLTVTPDYLDFGTMPVGDTAEAAVEVSNWSGQPVRLIGGTSDCSCTTLGDLPVTIPPGGRTAVTIRLAAGSNPGHVTRTVLFQTDSPDQPRVRVRLGGRVE